ncbi:GNAT family N-acetyltransferase [Nonomuraea sp. N2-4H]|jgi:hypothetical protein|uniref:GNAT family N-acetyltransferase n=1 Tax=unclassified Nonomuraea TaxID=2593643 RepID=UPI003247227F
MPLRSEAELRAACGDADLVMWTGQGLRGRARAWALGDAVVAACPGISRGDRLAVHGPVPEAVRLVRHALAELGPTYRPWGEAGLLAEVTARVDGLAERGRFSWMSLPAAAAESLPAAVVDGGAQVGWLQAAEEAEVAELLAADAPHSYAVPGGSGVRRWAGIRLDGELAAVAADAWSAPTVGLLAGVATRARYRGRGLARLVCGWVTRQLVAAYGRAALMVDDDNPAAITVYEHLGYRRVRVMACHLAL